MYSIRRLVKVRILQNNYASNRIQSAISSTAYFEVFERALGQRRKKRLVPTVGHKAHYYLYWSFPIRHKLVDIWNYIKGSVKIHSVEKRYNQKYSGHFEKKNKPLASMLQFEEEIHFLYFVRI